MRSIAILVMLSLSSFLASGQGKNTIWCFGDSAGIDFRNRLSPVVFQSGINTKGTAASISDSLGNLLFYSGSPDIRYLNNGVLKAIIYNNRHEQMLNGDSLNCEVWYHEMVIVPSPENPDQYYVFHIGVTGQYGLYFSLVDKTLDSGRGAVISKNNQLRNDIATDCIQAVKHGNGRDWWIIYRSAPPSNNNFYVYSIDANGVELDHVDSLGPLHSSNGGDLRFNSDGTKFAFSNLNGLLAIYSFDRCTGSITLDQTIHAEFPAGTQPYFLDCCFSPNDSLLYVSCAPYFSSLDTTQIYLYQFPLTATNVYASRTLIWQQTYPMTIGAVRLAPDNKIYVAAQKTGYPYDSTDYYPENMSLSVINQPDQRGGAAACDFQPYSFYLGGKRTYWGLPNNPNYDLGPLAGSPCDTIQTALQETAAPTPALSVYYHSAWESIVVNASKLEGKRARIFVSDISGKILVEESVILLSGYLSKNIALHNRAAGIYFVTVVTEREKLTGKVILQSY